jgi:lipoprotein NlpI
MGRSMPNKQRISSAMKRFLALLIGAAFPIIAAQAAEPPVWPEWRAPMLEKFSRQLTSLDEVLAKTPAAISLLSQRGDCHLFLGQFPEAVADFERMIALDPAQDTQHWRLGIAYYFAGEFAKSARQFEKYHAYDGRDRENGIWKFLAQAKIDGIEKARAEMLSYAQFDREPFPALYEMFAGKRTPGDVLTEIENKNLAGETQVVFFGNYYAGLGEAMLGNRERALAFLEKAVSLPQARAQGGPGYMWQVARLHWERLRAEAAR